MAAVECKRLVEGKHEVKAFQAFKEMRDHDELCDVTLIVSNKEFRAHKVVLAGSSPYFRAMLTTGFSESDMGTIFLQDCDETSVALMIEFLYSCCVILDASNVEGILDAASLFQIPLIVEACGEFLEQLITVENCLGIQSLAIRFSLENLQSRVANFISWNFVDLAREPEFLLIPEQQLREIVSRDTLHIRAEEDVYEAVMRWFKHDEDDRLKHQDIMALVRFPLMDHRYIRGMVLQDDLFHSVPNWMKRVQDSLDLLSSPKKHGSEVNSRQLMTTPRKSPNVLYLVGATATRIEVFDPETDTCVPVSGMASSSSGTAIAIQNELFIVQAGGWKVHRYDSRQNSWAEISTGIKEHECAICGSMGFIYVIGSGKRAKCFNLSSQSWTNLPSMSIHRSYHTATVFQGKVYAIGGVTLPGNRSVSLVECFDNSTNSWEKVPQMNSTRHQHESVVVNNQIYVVGGYATGPSPLNSVEVFSDNNMGWSLVAPTNHPRRDFALGVLNGMLFVFGGRGTNTIERYDQSADKWTIVGTLSKRWSDFQCVNLPMLNFKVAHS